VARRPALLKILTGVIAVALVAAGVIAYQITHRGAPSFRKGGEFAAGLSPTTSATTAQGSVSPAPAPDPSTTTVPPSSAPATTASTIPSTTATTRRVAPATTATTRAAVRTTATTARPASNLAAPGTSATTVASPSQPAGPRLPAFGTYTYAVDGTEGASVVGTRRYPDRMTMVAHGAPGLAPDQVVFDLRYSDQHEEREIVSFKDDGVYFDFEGGSVTFGPRTETSETDYEPPMLQIPKPLQAGVSRSATVQAKNANGSVVRTEDVQVTVVGEETITAAGASVATWKVEVKRTFRPGSSEQGTRNRTYWFDPARSLWVKFTEQFHGERRTGAFDFTYDSNLTATLAEFQPG
jgi:hypothetical protein